MNNKKSEITGIAFDKLFALFELTQTAAQVQAARSVDRALVVRNWLFGWYIVEFENGGAERAELYGKKLLPQISAELKKNGLTGVSLTSLKQFRLFYQTYKEIGQAMPGQSLWPTFENISQASPDQSGTILPEPTTLQSVNSKIGSHFAIGWTHYVTLLTIKNEAARRFYKIETATNGWGYRELERQVNCEFF